jgi:hypothetical protein
MSEERVREWRQSNRGRRVENNTGRLVSLGVKHGKEGTYTNHSCRCDSCTDAWAQATSDRRLRRRRLLVERDGRMVAPATVRHGTHSTYTNWCCRCEPCTAAHRREGKRGAS